MRRLWIALLLVPVSCSQAVTPPLTVKTVRDLAPVHSLVVMPASASPTIIGEAAAQAPEAISRMLRAEAARETQWTLVSEEQEAAARSQLTPDTPEGRAGQLAGLLHVDAALTATIATYRERVGSAYGVTEPASVSLQVLLVRAGEKQAAWRADYTQTQEPLAYNLFKLWAVQRGGAKWLTADELAKIGVDEAVKELAAATAAGARPALRRGCRSVLTAWRSSDFPLQRPERILFSMKRIAIAALLSLLAAPAEAARIYTMEVKGPIFTPVLQYLSIALDQAEKGQAAALLLELDTPGGALDTTKEIVQTILAAPLPVIVYVSPSGAGATSAGTFVTLAAHVAAMRRGRRSAPPTPCRFFPATSRTRPWRRRSRTIPSRSSKPSRRSGGATFSGRRRPFARAPRSRRSRRSKRRSWT